MVHLVKYIKEKKKSKKEDKKNKKKKDSDSEGLLEMKKEFCI